MSYKDIKMIVSDFDGVFTDGSVCIYDDGKMFKKIHYVDIMGVSVALKNGYKVALISGETSSAVNFIAKKFDDKLEVFQQIRDKLGTLKELMKKHNLSSEEVLYIGDDVNDVECLNYVRGKYTVPNANKNVKKVEGIKITQTSGGSGAFREVIDELIDL